MTAGAIILVLRSKCRFKKFKGIVLGSLQLIYKPDDMLTAFATSVLVLLLVLPQRMVTLKGSICVIFVSCRQAIFISDTPLAQQCPGQEHIFGKPVSVNCPCSQPVSVNCPCSLS